MRKITINETTYAPIDDGAKRFVAKHKVEKYRNRDELKKGDALKELEGGKPIDWSKGSDEKWPIHAVDGHKNRSADYTNGEDEKVYESFIYGRLLDESREHVTRELGRIRGLLSAERAKAEPDRRRLNSLQRSADSHESKLAQLPESTQLDELTRKTLDPYFDKARDKYADAAVAGDEAGVAKREKGMDLHARARMRHSERASLKRSGGDVDNKRIAAKAKAQFDRKNWPVFEETDVVEAIAKRLHEMQGNFGPLKHRDDMDHEVKAKVRKMDDDKLTDHYMGLDLHVAKLSGHMKKLKPGSVEHSQYAHAHSVYSNQLKHAHAEMVRRSASEED